MTNPLAKQRLYTSYTEGAYSEAKVDGEKKDWFLELRGRNGKVYMYNDLKAVAFSDKSRIIPRLARLGFTNIHRDARPFELEVSFDYNEESLKTIGSLLKLRKRRTVKKYPQKLS